MSGVATPDTNHLTDSYIPDGAQVAFGLIILPTIIVALLGNTLLLWALTHEREGICDKTQTEIEAEVPGLISKLMCVNSLLLYTVLIYQVRVVLQDGTEEGIACKSVGVILNLTIAMSECVGVIYSWYQWTKLSDKKAFETMFTSKRIVFYVAVAGISDVILYLVPPFLLQYGSYGFASSSHMCFIEVPKDEMLHTRAFVIYWFWAILIHLGRSSMFIYAQSMILNRLSKQTTVVDKEVKQRVKTESMLSYHTVVSTTGNTNTRQVVVESQLATNLLGNYLNVKGNTRVLALRTILLVILKASQAILFIAHIAWLNTIGTSMFNGFAFVTALLLFLPPLADIAIILTFNTCARRKVRMLLADLGLMKK